MGVKLKVRSLWPGAGAEAGAGAGAGSEELVYELAEGRVLIGRGRGADVCLPHRAVSLRHATLRPSSRGGYVIVDHASTNGTVVAGKALVPEREKPLRSGDEIHIGGFLLVFSSGVPVSPTTAEKTASMAKKLARAALGSGEGSSPGPRLVVRNGPEEGRVIELPEAPARLRIGRDPGCEIVLDDADVSREHAELAVEEEGVRLTDLGSKNGILVEGKTLRSKRLRDRDELRLGATLLLFEDPAEAALHELEEMEDLKVDALPELPAEPASAPAPPAEPASVAGPPAEPASVAGPPPDPEAASERAALERAGASKAKPAAPKRALAGLDMIIYTLAALVLAASLLGLLWLVRAG